MSDSQQLRLKLCLIKYELDINKFLNCSFSSVVFCLFAKVTFLHQKQRKNYQNQTLYNPENEFSSTFFIRFKFEGNRCQTLNGGGREFTNYSIYIYNKTFVYMFPVAGQSWTEWAEFFLRKPTGAPGPE